MWGGGRNAAGSRSIGATANGPAVLLRTTMPTRVVSCKANDADLYARPDSSKRYSEREANRLHCIEASASSTSAAAASIIRSPKT
jgi:hypothetical protein